MSTRSAGQRRRKDPADVPADFEGYRTYVQGKLERLVPVFAKALVGDFSERFEIPDEDDEFAELYAGVDILLSEVRKRIGQLEVLNRTLEGKVTERTKELSENLNELVAVNEAMLGQASLVERLKKEIEECHRQLDTSRGAAR